MIRTNYPIQPTESVLLCMSLIPSSPLIPDASAKAFSGLDRHFAGIIVVYRRLSATAEFYTSMGLDLPRCAGFLGLSVFTSESPQTECGFQAIVDLLHRRRRKATDHLVDPRLLDCDQVIARHERIV